MPLISWPTYGETRRISPLLAQTGITYSHAWRFSSGHFQGSAPYSAVRSSFLLERAIYVVLCFHMLTIVALDIVHTV